MRRSSVVAGAVALGRHAMSGPGRKRDALNAGVALRRSRPWMPEELD